MGRRLIRGQALSDLLCQAGEMGVGGSVLRLFSRFDPLSNRTTYSYDPGGQQMAVENSFGARTTTLYNADGQDTACINALRTRRSQVL